MWLLRRNYSNSMTSFESLSDRPYEKPSSAPDRFPNVTRLTFAPDRITVRVDPAARGVRRRALVPDLPVTPAQFFSRTKEPNLTGKTPCAKTCEDARPTGQTVSVLVFARSHLRRTRLIILRCCRRGRPTIWRALDFVFVPVSENFAISFHFIFFFFITFFVSRFAPVSTLHDAYTRSNDTNGVPTPFGWRLYDISFCTTTFALVSRGMMRRHVRVS